MPMTEKRVVTLNILLDGTGNNRRVDKAKGKESNVARIGDTLEADYSFDVSKGLRDNPAFASTLSEVSGDTLGNRRALAEFIKNDTSSSTINAYYEGIGSNENDSVVTQKIQGGTGSGFEERVKYFAKMIKEIHDADPDAEIKLNVVGFSRGAAEAKALLNELASDDHSHILVNKVVLFDTVVAKDNPMSTAHSDVDLDFPKELIPNPENVLELNSSNESRSSFPLTPYQQEGVLTRWFPGVHAQIGGGYSNDILAYAGYAAALNHLSKNTSTSAPLELRQLSLEQTVLIAVSHIILQNPYMTRAFLIDSRVMVDSATSTEDNTYYGEESQEGFFDRATDPRRVIDETRLMMTQKF